MPRVCTVCDHPERAAIDLALVGGEAFRDIAGRSGLAKSAIGRHRADHLPATLADAAEPDKAAAGTDLLREVRDARACLELLAEVEGELDRR